MNELLIDGILLLYAHPYAENAPTIKEHVNAFKKYSKSRVWDVNTFAGFPKGLPKLEFRVIVLHYSLFGSYPFVLNEKFIRYLQNSKASYKIAFFQDEYQYCPKRFAFVDELGINCIFSLLEPKYFNDVYYKFTKVGHVFHTLTGYVDDALIEKMRQLHKPYLERAYDVGYRARRLPFWMGKDAQEKADIADKFLLHADGLGFVLDIKTGENNRIYGDAWYEFLSNCRAVIGVEAGTSIFDIEDKVRPAVERLAANQPNIGFDEVYEKFLAQWEGIIYYRTISPRVFEAAALRVCQVLYEGAYQGILIPMRHYIPLKKDFSNFDVVIEHMRDEALVKKLTDQAYDEIIASGKYNYRNFVKEFDETLASVGVVFAGSVIDPLAVDLQLRRGRLSRALTLRAKHFLHKKWPGKSIVKRVLSMFLKKG